MPRLRAVIALLGPAMHGNHLPRLPVNAGSSLLPVPNPLDGKLYVGSAKGDGGIWLRWSQYVNGHGNNVELVKLIESLGRTRARAFRFSILEIADLQASPEEILKRESHWKQVLLTRTHGYNAN